MKTFNNKIKIKTKRVKCQIPDKFPLFEDWSKDKITMMSNLSSVDYCTVEDYYQIDDQKDEESEILFTIATDELYDTNDSGKCCICGEKINIEYKEDIEEWIYPSCTVMDRIHVVHILCNKFK